ncbi:sensor histidine kinase, partial [candidate division KSB1 bacterium]|nr:sensor histidine kinase [candidate division KSB1 bacterium]
MAFDIYKERIPTFFAPSERATNDELKHDIEIISQNPIIDGVMQTTGGLLAVLNEHRQIVSVNDALLKMLGCDDAKSLLGLRPGEAIDCIYAEEMPGGCGTSKFCSTCGAAIAIVTALNGQTPQERTCALTIGKGESKKDLHFSVRSVPLLISKRKYILLFLQDITQQHQWAALQRIFFHDLSNLVMGLIGVCEMIELEKGDNRENLINRLHKMALRFSEEIAIQKALSQSDFSEYSPNLHTFSPANIFNEIKSFFERHPVATNKKLTIADIEPELMITTDPSILLRILTNMLTNAFEATADGGEVKLYLEKKDKYISFCVWNKSAIPDDVTHRIFQRHFSTKNEPGRGLGTFSMKFFGEKCLN